MRCAPQAFGNIDILNNWVGKLTCLMLVPVIFAMIYEVVARKVFIAPTDWAYDTSRMFSGAMFMVGAGYALMRGVHIRADFLFNRTITIFLTCLDRFSLRPRI